MNITKAGPPEFHGIDLDTDFYFTLNNPEVETLSDPVTQAVIAAQLTPLAPPFGAVAAILVLNYIQLMQTNAGLNGVSVKCTVRQGAATEMSEFIAQPI
jgi:hypothetical protein